MTGGLAAPMVEHDEGPEYPSWDLAAVIGLKLQLESALAGEAAALERVAELEAGKAESDELKPKAASDIAAEILRKHLGPAMFEDAINSLAKHVPDGELLAVTDPVKFLNAVTSKLQCVQELAQWSQEPCLSRDSKAYCRAMDDVLGKMRALGLVEEGK